MRFWRGCREVFSRQKLREVIKSVKLFVKVMLSIIQRFHKTVLTLVSKSFCFLKCWRLTLISGLLCCSGLMMLFVNRHAEQAPAWIATALSIGCSGVISMVTNLKESKSKFRMILPIVLFLVFIASFLGSCATLQPVAYQREIEILTMIKRTENKIFPEETTRILGNIYPYMYKVRDVISDELKQRSRKKEDWFANVREISSSSELAEFLILDELGFLFSKSWKIAKIERREKLGALHISQSWLDEDTGNVLTKRELQEKLQLNMFIRRFPDQYQIHMPPGMVLSKVLNGDQSSALVFEDKYCKVKIEPTSPYFRQIFHQDIRVNEELFVFGLTVQIEVLLKRLWIGSKSTREREELWINPLLEYVKHTFSIPEF